MSRSDQVTWAFIGLMTAAAVTVSLATEAVSQPPQPPPSMETRLDQCNAERGQLITEGARMNFMLREAQAALAAEKAKHPEPKSDKGPEPKK